MTDEKQYEYGVASNPDGTLSIPDVRRRCHNAIVNTATGRYLDRAMVELENVRRELAILRLQMSTSRAEVDEELFSCLASHESVTDLLHTLDSYQGVNRYCRTAFDSAAVIRNLMRDNARLRAFTKAKGET